MDEYLRPSAKGISQIGAYFSHPSDKKMSFYVYVTFFKEREPLVWVSYRKYKRYSPKVRLLNSAPLESAPEEYPECVQYNTRMEHAFFYKKECCLGLLSLNFGVDFFYAKFSWSEFEHCEGLKEHLGVMCEYGDIFGDGVKTNPVRFDGRDINLPIPKPYAPSSTLTDSSVVLDGDVPF